jgi:hypothetical protein
VKVQISSSPPSIPHTLVQTTTSFFRVQISFSHVEELEEKVI